MPFNDDQREALEAAGVDPDLLIGVDPGRYGDWLADNPDWAEAAGRALSYEASIVADTIGAPPPSEWSGITIIAEPFGLEGEWSVEVVDSSGTTWTIPLGDDFDLAWDYYDAAGYYDFDVEKDIDTGGPE